MDRRPQLILGGAAVVVIAGLALVIKLRGGDEKRAPAPEATPTRIERTLPEREDRAERPERPEREDHPGRDSTPTVSETTVDGAQVRDHRSGARVPYEGRPRDGAVRKERLPAALVRDISGKLQESMTSCAAAIPAEARGSRPGVAGAVFVDVVSETLIVKEAALAVRDVSGDAAESAKRCLEQSWVGQSTPARATLDTSRYEITVAFALPR